MSSWLTLLAAAASSTLDDLANATGTDKRRDEHAYVSVYEMLWDPIRFWMRNVTEVGVLGVHFETSCLT